MTFVHSGAEPARPLGLPIHLRAYAIAPDQKPARATSIGPSEWTLVFDTETTTDHAQALRFGTYQWHRNEQLIEAGLFYRPEGLTPDECELLAVYAQREGLKLHTQTSFIEEVLFRRAYRSRATIVGFNLPFDISRIAIDHGHARGSMRGGFTFTLSPNRYWPQLRVRHISSRISLMSFAAPAQQRTGKTDRNRGRRSPVRRGFFVDVATLAHALLSRSFSLASLADHLRLPKGKASTNDHGGALTADYIAYAVQDTQVTWECYCALKARYEALRLDTPLHRIFSEASLGKAYLAQMGVRPWREVQSDVPPELIGIIMSTFYGGRSEVRQRHAVSQVVLCDFLSMYPTVVTLMRLWRFVIARGMSWRDSTADTRAFLEAATLDMLRDREVWKSLATLVQIEPDGHDILPVRAVYPGSPSATIGANHLEAPPLWFTLADCLASKILTGRTPKVIRAITFTPDEPQSGLRPVAINGDARLRIHPVSHDFYEELIRRRQSIKAERDAAERADRDRLDANQNALKIAANATSYGIFAEIIVDEPSRKLQSVAIHGGAEKPFTKAMRTRERPGRYFHPLLATLITGAARLMLAITERLATDAGLDWAFCDTDSMALARPSEMDEATFYARVDEVVGWFASLNPYGFPGSVLQVEKVNAARDGSGRREALFCFAISAKRYVLFNVNASGAPVLRKASAHGLGHLRAPYDDSDPAPTVPAPQVSRKELGVERWQHDLWWTIASAALRNPVRQISLDYHPKLQLPAVSRYAATTPKILDWFKGSNANRPYDRQVRPFGFLNAFTAVDDRAVVAPFDRDLVSSTRAAFDRDTGERIEVSCLKTYAHALAGYHLSPEAKFENGRPFDQGRTARRRVRACGFVFIGKEANRWEEAFYLGPDPDAEVVYGSAPDGHWRLLQELKQAKASVGERRLADALGISRETLRGSLTERLKLGERVREVTTERLPAFWDGLKDEREKRDRVSTWLMNEIDRNGLTAVAARFGYDPANLAAIRAGRRTVPSRLLPIITAAIGN